MKDTPTTTSDVPPGYSWSNIYRMGFCGHSFAREVEHAVSHGYELVPPDERVHNAFCTCSDEGFRALDNTGRLARDVPYPVYRKVEEPAEPAPVSDVPPGYAWDGSFRSRSFDRSFTKEIEWAESRGYRLLAPDEYVQRSDAMTAGGGLCQLRITNRLVGEFPFPVYRKSPDLPPAAKPPLGLRPRHAWLEVRVDEIERAMMNYGRADKAVPIEWTAEWAALKDELAGNQQQP